MTPEQFVAKWKASTLSEEAGSQSQFGDLCEMLGEPSPSDADFAGATYAFQKGTSKATGASGWADIWKRDFFAWEYKSKGKNLDAAFAQLQQYAGALGNPPLLVVSDMVRFRITTAWTNTVSKVYELTLDDLLDPAKREILKWVLSDPDKLKPGQTRQALTEDAAEKFAVLARRLRERGHEAHRVAHFVNRLVFCMFAEDADLLPNKMFQRMVEASVEEPERFEPMARQLFAAMKAGGLVGFEKVEWFNGGLFDDDDAIALDKEDIKQVLAASKLDWTEIDPSILGTLFERGLDPDKRSQLGAHYTDREKILLIVEPVIVRPLLAEWAAERAEIEGLLAKAEATKNAGQKTKLKKEAVSKFRAFLDRLRAFRVLDPACGSGNFLYLALLALKDIEHRVSVEGEVLGFQREFPQVGPECALGIEINPYAAELARVSVWIGEIQWMKRNGFGVRRNPILRPLSTIENRDALFPSDPAAPWPDVAHLWPKADVVIGNPPFLGDKMMISSMGEDYVTRLRSGFAAWLPGGADLVCYWFAIADRILREGRAKRAGLVATNSIRSGANRRVLDEIVVHQKLFEAWSDEEWTVEGASVRVSVICFENGPVSGRTLNGISVDRINADLTANAYDLTTRRPIQENAGVSFIGVFLNGEFEVEGALARKWLLEPANPNGRKNADVLRPTLNGSDFNGNRPDKWVVDFGVSMSEEDAALYESPFGYIEERVKPLRLRRNAQGHYAVRREGHRRYWWRYAESRPGMRRALAPLSRYIATPMVSSYRTFGFLPVSVLPDQKLVVFAKDDECFLGIMHSRFHELWTRRTCSWIGSGNDITYSTTSVFLTFPFPDGMTPNLPAASYVQNPYAVAIATAVKRLDELRRNWLNPSDLVDVVPEVVPGFPDRILPKNEAAAAILKKRTLANLYNERPAWLDNAHRDLDAAVAAAYGWPADISEDDALAALLALNHERSASLLA